MSPPAQGGDRREFLASTWIFEGLDDAELDRLVAITSTRKLRARETLFTKGTEGDQFFGVMSGRLRISTSGPDGKEIVFMLMEPGDVVGEIALLDSHPRSATVVAVEASELLTLQRRDFMPFLEAHPKVAIRLAVVLAGRLRRLSDQMEEALLLSMPARLARRLLQLARDYGRTTRDGVLIDMRLPQQQIGELIGATRESVNKILRRWTDHEIVRVDRRRVTIVDEAGLKAIAEMDD